MLIDVTAVGVTCGYSCVRCPKCIPYISTQLHSTPSHSSLSSLVFSYRISLNLGIAENTDPLQPIEWEAGRWECVEIPILMRHLTIDIDPFVARILLFSVRCDLAWEDCVDPLPLPIGTSTREITCGTREKRCNKTIIKDSIFKS